MRPKEQQKQRSKGKRQYDERMKGKSEAEWQGMVRKRWMVGGTLNAMVRIVKYTRSHQLRVVGGGGNEPIILSLTLLVCIPGSNRSEEVV